MNYIQQRETLELIQMYNKAENKKIIKRNLIDVFNKYKISKQDIITDLQEHPEKIGGWRNRANENYIPTLEDALRLSIKYGFSMNDLLDGIENEKIH